MKNSTRFGIFPLLIAVFMLGSFAVLPSISQAVTLQTSTTKLNDGSSLSQGLVGYWTFDGKDTTATTVQDDSGSGNTGTYLSSGVAASMTKTPGKIGQAVSLSNSGSSNHIISYGTNVSTYQFGTGSFSISGWINPQSQSQGSDAIFGVSTGASSARYALDFVGNAGGTGGTLFGFLRDDAGNTINFNPTQSTIPNGKWTHAVMTVDRVNKVMTLYVNGVNIGSISMVGITGNSSPQGIATSGGVVNGATPNFNGAMDDIRVYNRVLSPSEVLSLYAQGAGVTTQSSGTKLNDGSTLGNANGLIGYWTMDGKDTNFTTNTETDESGNGNTGTLISLPSSSATLGKIGQALKFNGTSSYINVPSPSNANLNALSISAWIYLTSIPTNLTILAGGPSSYQFAVSGGSLALFKAGVGGVVAGHSTITANKWYHVAVTYNGSLGKMYVNGQLDNTNTNSTTFNSPTTLSIGAYINGAPVQYVPGSIDDVRLYNRALSAGEISDLYDAGLGTVTQANGTKLNDGSTLGNANGLAGYYTMDGKDTNWATGKETDESGNGNTAYLTNMSTTSSPTIGKLGQAFSFTGNQTKPTYLIVPGTPFAYTTPFSVSVWEKTPSTVAVYESILGNLGAGPSGWDLGININGTARMTLRGTSSIDVGAGGVGPNLHDGKWHHIVAVNTLSSIQTYVDGVLVGTTNGTWTPVTTNVQFGIGTRTAGAVPGENFLGSLDDVRIYNRTLSAAEVQALYQEGK